MKRIVFVSLSNLYATPHIKKYIQAMNGEASYDIIMWNRHGVEEDDYGAKNVFAYPVLMDESLSKPVKLLHMIRFCNYAHTILKRENYDGVVVLHTNAAILLQQILCTKYSGKFILDIRDYSMEKNALYYQMEKRLVKHSQECFISSDGFRSFLPEGDYCLVHNNMKLTQEEIAAYQQRSREPDVIRVTFIGMVRFFEEGKRLAASIGSDPRFTVGYYGKNGLKMQEYIGETANHLYADHFPPVDTMKYYLKTDVINNLYGNNIYVDHLLSNKLYYSTQLRIPIIVSPNTYMAEIVQEYQIGFVYDLSDPSAPDLLHAYYQSIDWNAFDANCRRFCEKVEQDDLVFQRKIQEFIR